MNADNHSTDNHEESVSHCVDNESIDSWTFLGDESIHQDGVAVDNDIVEANDEDTKLASKTSRSSSSGLSDNNFLSVTHLGIDGDISDGISVISDCDSINDRHSPMPVRMTTPQKLKLDHTAEETNTVDESIFST